MSDGTFWFVLAWAIVGIMLSPCMLLAKINDNHFGRDLSFTECIAEASLGDYIVVLIIYFFPIANFVIAAIGFIGLMWFAIEDHALAIWNWRPFGGRK